MLFGERLVEIQDWSEVWAEVEPHGVSVPYHTAWTRSVGRPLFLQWPLLLT